MRLVMLIVIVASIVTGPVQGAILTSYEANDFPEAEGWTAGGTPPEPTVFTRVVEEGILRVDATPLGAATVFYHTETQITDERMFVEWSAQTSNDDGSSYISIRLLGQEFYSKILTSWRADRVNVDLYPVVGDSLSIGVSVQLTPGDFHIFRVASDGAIFTVSIDGTPQIAAELQSPDGLAVLTQFGFTKFGYLVPTQSEWDYVRIGVVPEPASALPLSVGLLWIKRRCSHVPVG